MEIYLSNVALLAGFAAMGAPLMPSRKTKPRPVIDRRAFNDAGHNLRRAFPVVPEND